MGIETSSCCLVADIGGTNTRIALSDGVRLRKSSVTRFRNAEFSGFDAVLSEFFKTNSASIDGICVALAGPIEDGIGHMTNLDWSVSKEMLHAATKTKRIAILNDLQAQGHALGFLSPDSLTEVLPGTPATQAARLVIGVGTGFNIAPVHDTQFGRVVSASESGHISLPARSDLERKLADEVLRTQGFASVEDVLSGDGIGRVDQWLHGGTRDAATVIKDAHNGDNAALATLKLCIGLLGTTAGDLALSHLPLGGVYLIGGVARALMPFLSPCGFTESFTDKGRFSDYMTKFPVHVVSDDFAALTGCARHLNSLQN